MLWRGKNEIIAPLATAQLCQMCQGGSSSSTSLDFGSLNSLPCLSHLQQLRAEFTLNFEIFEISLNANLPSKLSKRFIVPGCVSSGNTDYSSLEILLPLNSHHCRNAAHGISSLIIRKTLLNQRFSDSSCPPALSTPRGKRELNLSSALHFGFYPLHKALPSSLINTHQGHETLKKLLRDSELEILIRALINLLNSRSMLLREGLTPHQQQENEKYPIQTEPCTPPPP